MDFSNITTGIAQGLLVWEPILLELSHDSITQKRNSQGRTIKQIHDIWSTLSSNNTHRIVHLQYQDTRLQFPTMGKREDDRWIAIQTTRKKIGPNSFKLWK